MSEQQQFSRSIPMGEGASLQKFQPRSVGPTAQQQRSAVAIREQAGRVPPQAVDVEQAVLGAMLIEREAIPKAIEILPPHSFYDGRHQRIYQAMLSLFERGNPVDLVTLTEELKRREELDQVGSYYLTELTTSVASAANVEYHARIIAEKSLLRGMIETMTTVVGEAYDPSADAFDLLDRAEQEIFRISESQLRKASRTLNEVVMESFKQLEALSNREGGITGVPSGFPRLDEKTGGWQKSDLVVIAARPSMGKTALSLALARNAALHAEYAVPVAYFSLEMSAAQLAQRLLTSEARVDAQAARTGRLSTEDWQNLARAAGRLSNAPIFIDDTPGLGILELRAKCRRLKSEHDIGMVVVDYLQLMHGTRDGRNSNREQEIAQISRSLKALAKELDVPVIALAQLSRAVETRGGDKRPQLSDLRESGSIEQDADVVSFIYRAERYGILQDEAGRSTQGLADVIIAKQRNGPTGEVSLAFVDRYARFENVDIYYGDDAGFAYNAPLIDGGEGAYPDYDDDDVSPAPF
jgi:replicative DNA helicase